MRLHSIAFLVILLVSGTLLLMNTHQAHAQTDEITTARTDIVNAFQSIQTAETLGATSTDLQPLIGRLNVALQLEENATILQQRNNTAAASSDALQSIVISNNVALQAQNLGGQAQTATQARSTLAYAIALLTAVLAALAILEAHRIQRFIRRRRLRKAEIEYGDRAHAR